MLSIPAAPEALETLREVVDVEPPWLGRGGTMRAQTACVYLTVAALR